MHLKKYKDESWDFRKENTKYSNHGFHTYPAMMIPQVAKRLIDTYGSDKKILLDPFMGSGTALLEATLHDNFIHTYGIDINPLAILIAKVKTTSLDPTLLNTHLEDIIQNISPLYTRCENIELPNFFNIEYWFKPNVIRDLAMIKHEIDGITDKNVRNFFLVAFSETVRHVSNTRNSEFKLYRMSANMLEKHNPDTYSYFKEKAKKNIEKMRGYWKEHNKKCEVTILAEDSRKRTSIPDDSVDLIVTSPPYGDSRTTVAYGQFSRLALQWIGYDKDTVINIDKISLGGIPTKDLINNLNSQTTKKIVNKIANIDEKRARDVLSFYIDFDLCVSELDRVLHSDSHLCFVVGNRTVKGMQIPTDEIIVELFQAHNDYEHINTIIRNIPNKRMPKLNSPTNKVGNHSATMNEEWVVVMKKR